MRVVDIPSVIKILTVQGGTSQIFIWEQRKAVTRVNISSYHWVCVICLYQSTVYTETR